MQENSLKVCIPTLNECEAIGSVIDKIRTAGFEPLMIDGGSNDGTTEVAEDKNVEIIEQNISGGKGSAIKQLINSREEDILVFIDGDDTYNPKHIQKIVDPIINSDFDHVIGNRFHNMKPDSMTLKHKIGNKIANSLFTILYLKNYRDILSGFRAIRREKFSSISINSKGFGIETEMTARSVINNHNIKVVGTDYLPRKGESELNSYTDGIHITKTMIKCRLNK